MLAVSRAPLIHAHKFQPTPLSLHSLACCTLAVGKRVAPYYQPCKGPAPVPFWKVFNPHNRYTNDNLIMISFGNVGFKYFDERRQYWMGAAMWSTLISMYVF